MKLARLTLTVCAVASMLSGAYGCGDSKDSKGSADASTPDDMGDSPFDATTTCGLTISLGGELESSLTAQDSVACLSQISSGSAFDVEYVAMDGELARIRLEVDLVRAGETGASFPGVVTIEHDDGRSWRAADCTVSVSSNTDAGEAELGHAYLIAGRATCPMGALSDDQGNLSITGLAFVAQITWLDPR